MKKWFAAQELEALALPALQSSRYRIQVQAKEEGWQSRPREGRGGGREYYINSLPEAARIEMTRRTMNSEKQNCDADALLGASEVAARKDDLSPPLGRRAGLLAAFSSSTSDRAPVAGAGKAALSENSRMRIRGSARAQLVNLAVSFAETSGFAMAVARAQFVTLYNRGAIKVEPWIREEVPHATVRSMTRWHAQIVREGIEAVSGKYGHRKGTGQIDGQDDVREFSIIMMAENGHLTAKALREGIRARYALDIPKRTVQRFMATARDIYADAFLAAQNPDAWKNKRQVAFGSQSATVFAPNDVWEADGSPADIILLDRDAEKGKRRYFLVANLDVWTRRVTVHVTEVPKSTATLLLIRRCIVQWGKPTTQKTDNGSDYVSAHCIRAYDDLGIIHKPCAPYTPEGKPHIERFFKTLQHDLIMTLPGFIGHSVADRKAIESKKAFSARLGDAENLIEVSLTKDQLQARIDDWLAHDYHRRAHEGIGTSPMLKMASWTGPIQRIEDERALDVLLAEAPDTNGFRVVGKKGLRVENAAFIARELALHIGERVQVRLDPDDMGQIIVYSSEGEFICVAKCPERSGIDRREVAILGKQLQRDEQKALRQAFKASKRKMRLGELADDVAAMKRNDANSVLTFPRQEITESYSTPALEAAAEAARALAGIAPAPREISDIDRELAAEATAALPEAQIITLPERKADDQNEAPAFTDDVEFYAFALAHPEKLNPSQREYFESVVKHDTALQMRWSMRYGANAS